MYIQQYCTSGEFDAAGNLGGTPRPRAARAGSLVNRRHAARPSIDAMAQPAPDHVAGEMRTVVPRPNADHAIPLSLQLHAAARAHRSAQSGRVARACFARPAIWRAERGGLAQSPAGQASLCGVAVARYPHVARHGSRPQ